MLIVHSGEGKLYLDTIYDFSIVTDYEGNKTLQFSMSPRDPKYCEIREEVRITYDDCRYIVKQINERRNAVTIVCDLDMDDWKQEVYLEYAPEKNMSFAELIRDLNMTDWIVENAELVDSVGVTISLKQVTKYQILMEAKKWFGITYEFHNEPVSGMKRIVVKNPKNGENKGSFLSEELNLTKLEIKGDSSELITRLYPYSDNGDEILSISSISANEYIENHEYSDAIISAIWMTKGYTNAQDLYDAAVEYLKKLAQPIREYSCSIVDLAKMSDLYKNMEFHLYDRVSLLDDRRKNVLEFVIVGYTEYPLEPSRNVVELSNDYRKIEGINQSFFLKDSNSYSETFDNHNHELYTQSNDSTNIVRIFDIWSVGSSVYTNQSLHKQTAEFYNNEIYKEQKIEDMQRNTREVDAFQDINGFVTSIIERVLDNDQEVSSSTYELQWNETGVLLRSSGNDHERFQSAMSQKGFKVYKDEIAVFEIDEGKVCGKSLELDTQGSIKIGPFLLIQRSNGHLTLKKGES